jgi:hypothetical protein
MKTLGALLLSLVAALGVSGCAAEKSSNPLTPTVAGPIPGVDITAPKVLTPAATKIPVDQQPLTLLAENASSSGVRPLTYLFEIATDTGFANKVFIRDNVAPGDGGRTSLRLPDRLAPERTYFWRARAQDGANTGPYSSPAAFDVYTPIVVGAPTLIAPAPNEVLTTAHPRFVLGNAPRSGPVGSIGYVIEVSDTDSFANKLGIWTFGESSGQTTWDAPADLPFSKTVFWHARAFDPTTNGPWSETRVFQTGAAPVVTPPPGGGGGGGGGGNWESCPTGDKQQLSECVVAAVNPAHTEAGAFEVTKRIAWLLRGEGGGLLIKNGGENIVSWKGYSFAAARICYPDGHIYKVLSDVPSTNGPSWQDNGFVDRSLYVPAIDPR